MLRKSSSYNTIHPNRIIPQWPEEIRNRIRIGDWEGDTVYGGIGKGLPVTLIDRRSRFLRMGFLSGRSAEETGLVVERLLRGVSCKECQL